MLREWIRAAALFAMLLSAAPAIAVTQRADEPTPYLVDNNVIAKIICGEWMGTGVYVGNGLIATARHVLGHIGPENHCTAGGYPATVVAESLEAGSDFALLQVDGRAEYRALIDCGGFHEGALYLASGYAEGGDASVTQLLTGSSAKSHDKGFAGLGIFRGSVTQGMSGGPIVRLDNGALVGIINANTEDGITEVLGLPLSSTPLCKKPAG